MPRPVTVLPFWVLSCGGRGFQPCFSAAALSTAASRGSFTYFSRNSTGSTPSECATSSQNDSLANWICGPTGSRRCEVRSGEARSSSGWMVSHHAFLFGEGVGLRRAAEAVFRLQRRAEEMAGERALGPALVGLHVPARERLGVELVGDHVAGGVEAGLHAMDRRRGLSDPSRCLPRASIAAAPAGRPPSTARRRRRRHRRRRCGHRRRPPAARCPRPGSASCRGSRRRRRGSSAASASRSTPSRGRAVHRRRRSPGPCWHGTGTAIRTRARSRARRS